MLGSGPSPLRAPCVKWNGSHQLNYKRRDILFNLINQNRGEISNQKLKRKKNYDNFFFPFCFLFLESNGKSIHQTIFSPADCTEQPPLALWNNGNNKRITGNTATTAAASTTTTTKSENHQSRDGRKRKDKAKGQSRLVRAHLLQKNMNSIFQLNDKTSSTKPNTKYQLSRWRPFSSLSLSLSFSFSLFLSRVHLWIFPATFAWIDGPLRE